MSEIPQEVHDRAEELARRLMGKPNKNKELHDEQGGDREDQNDNAPGTYE